MQQQAQQQTQQAKDQQKKENQKLAVAAPMANPVILLLDFFNLRDSPCIYEVGMHIGVHIYRAAHKHGLAVLEVCDQILTLFLFSENLDRIGRGVVRDIEIDYAVSAVL